MHLFSLVYRQGSESDEVCLEVNDDYVKHKTDEGDSYEYIVDEIFKVVGKVEKEFKNVFQKSEFNYESFSKNLNELINTLKINIKDMSKYTLCDASSISRMRYGKIKPSEPVEFANKIASYVTNKCSNETDRKKIEKLNFFYLYPCRKLINANISPLITTPFYPCR